MLESNERAISDDPELLSMHQGQGRVEIQASLSSAFAATLKRDVLLAGRNLADIANPLIFFAMVISLLPLGIGPERAILAAIAPGMLWIVALLATLLCADTLFRSDFDDGSLEQLLISPQPLYLQVLAKVLAHWLITGLPLTLLSPLLALMLGLPDAGFVPLMMSLLLGTACLSLIGAVGAALTVALRKGGLLLSLILVPLYVPVLIFGASAVASSVEGFSAAGQLSVLGAFLALSIVLAPVATSAALRVSVNG